MPKLLLKGLLEKKKKILKNFKIAFFDHLKIFSASKFRIKMFNLYQSMNKKDDQDKEKDVIGHDRFCQERPSRSSVKKKKKITRRTRSAGEFSSISLNAANKRVAFKGNRSQSNEQGQSGSDKTPSRSESLVKLFSKRSRFQNFYFLKIQFFYNK